MTTRTYAHSPPIELIKTPFLYPASQKPLDAGRVIVEIGPGRGDFLFHLAESNPDATVVGIEIRRKRVDKLIKRVERRCLANVRIIQDDARAALPRFLADASVDEIHINFPDPWPKRRHAKHRAISLDFLSECKRVLKAGGTISVVTDSRTYAENIAADAAAVPGLDSIHPEAIVASSQDAYPTFYAQKWLGERRQIAYQKYRRTK